MGFKLPKIYQQEEEEELERIGGLNDQPDDRVQDKRDDLQALNARYASAKADKRKRKQNILTDRQTDGRYQTATMPEILQAQERALESCQASLTNEGQASPLQFARSMSRFTAKYLPRESIGGKLLPKAKATRSPLLDKMPVLCEDLGVSPKSFVHRRQINEQDWLAQLESQDGDLMGSNMNKLADFKQIFERGKSKIYDPKIDLAPRLRQSAALRKDLLSRQILRNLHPQEGQENLNALQILQELGIHEEDRETLREMPQAEENETWRNTIKSLL